MKAQTKNSLGCPLMNLDTPQNSSKTSTLHIPTNLVLRLLRCFRSPLPSPHFLFPPHLRQSFPTLVPSFPRLVAPLHPFLRPPSLRCHLPPSSSRSFIPPLPFPPTTPTPISDPRPLRPRSLIPPSSVTLCLTSHVLLPLLFFSLSFFNHSAIFSVVVSFSQLISIKPKQIYKRIKTTKQKK